MAVADLAKRWLARADQLAPYADPAAAAFRAAAAELETELRAAADEILTLEQASRESGFAPDSLRHQVSDGRIPNAGRRGAPRIRRGDLPRKAAPATSYDATSDALSLVSRRKVR